MRDEADRRGTRREKERRRCAACMVNVRGQITNDNAVDAAMFTVGDNDSRSVSRLSVHRQTLRMPKGRRLAVQRSPEIGRDVLVGGLDWACPLHKVN